MSATSCFSCCSSLVRSRSSSRVALVSAHWCCRSLSAGVTVLPKVLPTHGVENTEGALWKGLTRIGILVCGQPLTGRLCVDGAIEVATIFNDFQSISFSEIMKLLTPSRIPESPLMTGPLAVPLAISSVSW